MRQKLILGMTLMTLGLGACTKDEETKNATKPTEETKTATAAATGDAPMTQTAPTNALKIEEVKVGTGDVAVSGKTVVVHYTGWLTNGTKFDSSVDRGEAFEFPLGQGRVIQGWDQGVANMKVGGKRKLTIPAELGYGARDMGVIPPNSVLVFDVELLKVK